MTLISIDIDYHLMETDIYHSLLAISVSCVRWCVCVCVCVCLLVRMYVLMCVGGCVRMLRRLLFSEIKTSEFRHLLSHLWCFVRCGIYMHERGGARTHARTHIRTRELHRVHAVRRDETVAHGSNTTVIVSKWTCPEQNPILNVSCWAGSRTYRQDRWLDTMVNQGMDKWTDRQTAGQVDRLVDWCTGRQIARQTGAQTDRQTDKWTNRQASRQLYIQTDSWTDRAIDRQADRQAGGRTDI